MTLRRAIRRIAVVTLVCGIMGLAQSTAKAQDWGRYYHWPYSDFHQYQWTPYQYEQVYDGNYRYPKQMREFQTRHGWRNWLSVRKPYYRGNHFILDRF